MTSHKVVLADRLYGPLFIVQDSNGKQVAEYYRRDEAISRAELETLLKLKHQAKQDARIEHALVCSGVQINVMDINRVFKVGRVAITAGANDEVLQATIREFVNTIKLN